MNYWKIGNHGPLWRFLYFPTLFHEQLSRIRRSVLLILLISSDRHVLSNHLVCGKNFLDFLKNLLVFLKKLLIYDIFYMASMEYTPENIWNPNLQRRRVIIYNHICVIFEQIYRNSELNDQIKNKRKHVLYAYVLNLKILNLRFKNIVALTSISQGNTFELFTSTPDRFRRTDRQGVDQLWAPIFDRVEIRWSLFHRKVI